MPRRRVTTLALRLMLLSGVSLSGCAAPRPAPPPLTTEPLGVQVRRADPALPARFAVLLGFEGETDAVFQRGGTIARGPRAVAHTGTAALAVTRRVTIKLSSLLSEGLPGEWTLLGAYAYADGPATAVVQYHAAGNDAAASRFSRRVTLPARQWTAALVDLAPLADGPAGGLTFEFDGPVRWLDDVLLVDNERPLVDTPAWSVREVGHRVVAHWPTGARRELPRPVLPAGNGDEVGPARIVLTDDGGRATVLYPDGRLLEHGRCVGAPLGLTEAAASAFLAQHGAPGHVTMPMGMGEVDRLSPGDGDNDGYDEVTGAYRLTARPAP